MVSVERVQEYCSIKSEAVLELAEKKPPDSWPDQGAITGQNMCFGYHDSMPRVLNNITFHIKPKEKVW